MGDSVGDDIIRPFLQCTGINHHLIRIVRLQIMIEEVIQRDNDMQSILMDHFKRSQPHQCLLMPVIQVNRNISVIDSRHISIENTGSQSGILFLSRHPIEESGVTGNSQNLTVQTFNIASGLGRMHTLQRTAFQGIVAESHVSFRTIVIRYYIFQFRSTVRSSRPSCSGIANCRGRCLRASGMVEHLTFHVHFRCMRLPVHGQTG